MKYKIIIDQEESLKELAIEETLKALGLMVKTTDSGVSFHYDGKTIYSKTTIDVESIWDIIYLLNQSPARGLYTIKQDGVLCWKAHTTVGGGWGNQGSSFQQVTEGIPTNIPNVTGVFKINGWVNQDNSSVEWHWVFASSREEAEKVLAQHLRPN